MSDLKELALKITTDPDHQFDLALSLDDLDSAHEIARTVPENEADVKWKALGDRALAVWRFDLARECFEKADDLIALMLLLMSTGDREGLGVLARKAGTFATLGGRFSLNIITVAKGQNNLAFAIKLQLGDVADCVDLLLKTQRAPEAAIFARTYAPSQVPKAVAAWKSDLAAKGRSKISDTIADPVANPDMFEEGWESVLIKEQQVSSSCMFFFFKNDVEKLTSKILQS